MGIGPRILAEGEDVRVEEYIENRVMQS
jgi:hypothetical protein